MRFTDKSRSDPPLALPMELPDDSPRVPAKSLRWRVLVVCFGIGLAVVYAQPLFSLFVYAVGTSLHSHVVLVPLISAYLISIQRKQLPPPAGPFYGGAILFLLTSGVVFAIAMTGHTRLFSENDYLALMAFSFVCAISAGGFFFYGREWMRAVAFPIAFLLFMIPLPDAAAEWLETASKLASAEAAAVLFSLTGTPVLRDGLFFQLPGILIEVAQECSGIRSSWVLFITSVLAAHLFLRTSWSRIMLAAFVLPLGIIRNGFRILVIALLCVHIGPDMIDSVVHRRGGPVFFVISLIPLFLLMGWLRGYERRKLARRALMADAPTGITPG